MNTVKIEVLDLENLNAENVGNSFLTTLQSSNWKVMICYNLVFNFKIFCHNYGSILILILFIAYIVFMVFFYFKEISPIKVEVSRIIFEELEAEKEIETQLINYYDKKNRSKLNQKNQKEFSLLKKKEQKIKKELASKIFQKIKKKKEKLNMM